MIMNQIINFLNIYPQIKNKKTNIQTIYKLNKIFEFCEKESKFYFNKLNDIFNKYGEKDKEGNLIKTESGISIKKEKIQECEKEIQELLNIEVTFDNNLKINLNDLNDFEMDIETFQKIKNFIKE